MTTIVKRPVRTKGAIIHFGPKGYMRHMREWWEREQANKAAAADETGRNFDEQA